MAESIINGEHIVHADSATSLESTKREILADQDFLFAVFGEVERTIAQRIRDSGKSRDAILKEAREAYARRQAGS